MLLSLLWEQFQYGSFLFQQHCTSVHKGRSIRHKTWMSGFGEEELDWPAQRRSPDTLNLADTLFGRVEAVNTANKGPTLYQTQQIKNRMSFKCKTYV